MRRILGVLDTRPDGEHGTQERTPLPRLNDLDSLVERCRSAGMRIEFEREGLDASLDAGIELAVYRVIPEALTNVLKHAGSAVVSVRVRIDDALHLEVTDDGVGLAAAKRADGRGRGVIGMRARVESVGGEFHADARPGGGWVVRATIPLPPSANRVDADPATSVTGATPATMVTG